MDLPLELIFHVVNHLGLRDILNLGQAQRTWQELLRSPQVSAALLVPPSLNDVPALDLDLQKLSPSYGACDKLKTRYISSHLHAA